MQKRIEFSHFRNSSESNLDPVITYPLKPLLQYPLIFKKYGKLYIFKISYEAVKSILINVGTRAKLFNVQNYWINVHLIGAEIPNKVRTRMRKSFPG